MLKYNEVPVRQGRKGRTGFLLSLLAGSHGAIKMKEPSWSRQVKIRDRYTCKFCGEGQFDHSFVDACHIKSKRDYPELADVVENGETLCLLCHIKSHYRKGECGASVLILQRLIKLMMKRANWPVITFKEYQALRTVFHEGMKYEKAAKIIGCSRQTVTRHINKIKKYYPHVIDEKGRLYFQTLPDNYESFIKEQF